MAPISLKIAIQDKSPANGDSEGIIMSLNALGDKKKKALERMDADNKGYHTGFESHLKESLQDGHPFGLPWIEQIKKKQRISSSQEELYKSSPKCKEDQNEDAQMYVQMPAKDILSQHYSHEETGEKVQQVNIHKSLGKSVHDDEMKEETDLLSLSEVKALKKKKKKTKKKKRLSSSGCHGRMCPNTDTEGAGCMTSRGPCNKQQQIAGVVRGKGGATGGGGGDGGGEEERQHEEKRTCDGGQKKKKKKREEKKEEEPMEVDEKPAQEEMEVCPNDSQQQNVIVNFLRSVGNALLQHAAFCAAEDCKVQGCHLMKAIYCHQRDCRGCSVCEHLKGIVDITHRMNCPMANCLVPFCEELKYVHMVGNAPPQADEGPRVMQPAQQASEVNQAPQAGDFKFKNKKIFASNRFRKGFEFDTMGDVGNGTHGDVKKILVKKDALTEQGQKLELLVKEAKYKVSMKEMLIMQILGQDERSFALYLAVTHGDDKGDYIFMQEEGMDLAKYMDSKESFLSPKEAKYYMKLVADGIQKMHGMKYGDEAYPIIHMDIKGKNLLLSKDGNLVKIADLDSANFLEHIIREKKWERAGTMNFVAPEVYHRMPYDTKCDIFSFGVTILELTVGVPQGIAAIPAKIAELHQLDPALANLAEACTQMNPDMRPSALEVLDHGAFHEYQTPSEV